MGARRGEGWANESAGGGAARRGRGCPSLTTCARRRHRGAAPGALPASPPPSTSLTRCLRSRSPRRAGAARGPSAHREESGVGALEGLSTHPRPGGLTLPGAARPVGSVVPTPFPPAGLTLTGNGAGPPAGLQAGGSRAAGNECFARKAKGAAIFSRFCQSLPPLPSPGAALGTAGLSLVPPQRCRAVQPQCRGSVAPAPCSGCDPLRAARDPSIRLSIHVSICPSTPACSAAHPPSAEPRGSPDTGSAAEGAPHTSQRRREQRRAAAAPQHCRPTPYPGLHRAGHSPGCDPTPQNSPGCDPIPTAVRWPRSPPLMLRHKEKVFHGRLLSPKSLT